MLLWLRITMNIVWKHCFWWLWPQLYYPRVLCEFVVHVKMHMSERICRADMKNEQHTQCRRGRKKSDTKNASVSMYNMLRWLYLGWQWWYPIGTTPLPKRIVPISLPSDLRSQQYRTVCEHARDHYAQAMKRYLVGRRPLSCLRVDFIRVAY